MKKFLITYFVHRITWNYPINFLCVKTWFFGAAVFVGVRGHLRVISGSFLGSKSRNPQMFENLFILTPKLPSAAPTYLRIYWVFSCYLVRKFCVWNFYLLFKYSLKIEQIRSRKIVSGRIDFKVIKTFFSLYLETPKIGRLGCSLTS